jgi:hypothetical protein
MPLTNFPNGVTSFGVPVLGNVGGIPYTGTYWFVDPATGADGNEGTSPEFPFKTLYRAVSRAASGNNDVVVLIGDGASTGTARLSAALAQTIDSTATDGTLDWSKNALHLVGVCAPTRVGQRARIAPPTGVYTAATFGADTFINVTGAGCSFTNVDIFVGFSTGSTSMIGVLEAGGRNYYGNVNIQGIADAASAGAAAARTLKITSSENTFSDCVLGVDTVTRTAANATVEFANATARNTFSGCTFPFQTSASTPLGIIASAASAMDRWQLFDGCTFINNVQSTSTTISGLSTLAASAGGLILMKNSSMVGITEFGTDATSRGLIYVDGAAPTAATSGIAVNPT